MINLAQYKSVIILDGYLPPFIEYREYITNKIIIVADGASTKIDSAINIDYIIGDLDSSQHYHANKIINIADQNRTDFEKCLDFVLEKKLNPVLVLGIGGGEIDHAINNIFVLCNHNVNDIAFIDINGRGTKFGSLLTNQTTHFKLAPNSSISLIPFPQALVTTNGLKWELNNTALNNSNFMSIRNYNIASQFSINVTDGKLLLIMDLTTKELE